MKHSRFVAIRLALVFPVLAVVICLPASTPAANVSGEIRSASYWLDQGALLSAYGNYDAAVKSYQKVLELAPNTPDALFQMGVCYGELRLYDQAISAMTAAIDQKPGEGAYYYGRGRIHLLAGDREQAMNDFMEAGVLGHTDARQFLEAQNGVAWE